jgi:hypothetical protein
MVRRLIPALLAAWALCYCLPIHAAGEFRIGLGFAINNNTPAREDVKVDDAAQYGGQLIDASAVWHDAIGNVDAQLSWTYIMASDFGTEQGVALTFVGGHRLQYGMGLVLGYTQAYERWQKLPENQFPDPIGARECTLCGITFQVGYEYKRLQLQLRYWRTDFNIYPGHNGALALITVRL